MTGDFNPRDFRRSLRGAGLSATQYRVAVELSEYSGIGKAIVWPAIATLAADCGVSRSTVKRALNGLESKGIAGPVGGRGVGRGHTTRWQLLIKLIKGVTDEPFYDGEKGSSVTEKGSSQTVKGFTGEPRSSKEEDKEGGRGARPHCPKHPENSNEACRACMKRREWDELTAQSQRDDGADIRAAIRAAIDNCTDCDFVGRLDDLSDCPKHPNFRKASAAWQPTSGQSDPAHSPRPTPTRTWPSPALTAKPKPASLARRGGPEVTR